MSKVTGKCKVCGKPLSGGKDIGPTCEEHLGLLEKYYIKASGQPDPNKYISLKELCDLAEKLGKSRYWMVKLTGGDAGAKPPFSPEFTVYKFEPSMNNITEKYCLRTAIASVIEIIYSGKK